MAEAAMPYRRGGQPVPGGPQVYPEMAPAGLWTTPSDLALYAIEVQKALAGKSNRVLSVAMARISAPVGRARQASTVRIEICASERLSNSALKSHSASDDVMIESLAAVRYAD